MFKGDQVRCLAIVALFWGLSACSGSAPQTRAAKAELPEISSPAAAAATASLASSSPPPARRDCIVVQDENPVPVRVVGVLAKTPSSPNGTDAPFVLQLKEARCVIGLPRASVVREVYVATAGPDLRPLLDRSIVIEGNAIGGLSDIGGPAVIVLAKSIENAALGTDAAP